jgi:hypothetical protein
MPANPSASKARQLLDLRTILASGRSGWNRATDSAARESIKDRVTEKLAALEAAVLRDGADPEVLARLEEARREVWE